MRTPRFLELTDAIGTVFSPEQIERVVYEATGDKLRNFYAGQGYAAQIAVRRTLENLHKKGKARWLLIYVLAAAITDRKLRRLVIQVYPETLTAIPRVSDEVNTFRRYLNEAAGLLDADVGLILARLDYKFSLYNGGLDGVSRLTSRLYALKSLHECLHALQLKVAFHAPFAAVYSDKDRQSRINDIAEYYNQTKNTWDDAVKLVRMIEDSFEAKHEVRSRLARLGRMLLHWRGALREKDIESASSYVTNLQCVLPEILVDLN